MPQVGDALDAVLLGCFLFGLLLAAASFVLGHADVGFHDGHVDGDHSWLPVSLGALLVALAWFGGLGYLLRGIGWPVVLALLVAAVAGLAIGALVQRATRALGGQAAGELRAEDDRLPGTIGRVTSSIRPGGVGEVVYEQRGARHVTAARAHDGQALPRGAEVVVVSVAKGMARVVALDDALGDDERAAIARGNDEQNGGNR